MPPSTRPLPFEIAFYGVRGSQPRTGLGVSRYGGDTSCVGVRAGDTSFFFDAGSGIAAANEELAGSCEPVALFISHLHHDHIMGLMFFEPLFRAGQTVTIYVPTAMPRLLEAYWSPPYFPVALSEAKGEVQISTVAGGEVLLYRNGVWAPSTGYAGATPDVPRLETLFLSERVHPRNGVMAYRIHFGGRSAVYASDNELAREADMEALARFARGADVLICDSQYTDAEYEKRRGWGHNSLSMATELARRAGVRRLLMFHHDTARDDSALAAMEEEARRRFPGAVAAREGMRIDLLATESAG